jgi:hypothetical protein
MQTMHRETHRRPGRRILLQESVGSGRRTQEVRACPGCGCELIQLMRWMKVAESRWELTLECPNCWWSGDGVYGPDEVAELEQRIEDGVAKMLRDLRRLANAIAAEELERFIDALHADLILPEDF